MIKFIQSMFLIMLATTAFADSEKSSLDVENALLTLQKQRQNLENIIKYTKKEEKDLKKSLAFCDKKIEEMTKNLSQLQRKIDEHTTSLTALQNEEIELKKTTKHHQAALKQLLQGSFLNFRHEKLKRLFEQQDWSYLSRQNQYYKFFYNKRAKEINILQYALKHTQHLQNNIIKEKNEISSLLAKQEKDKTLMLQAKEQRKNLLNTVAEKLLSNEEQLGHLQQQEQHLAQVFKELQKKLATTPSYIDPAQDFAKAKQKLKLPVSIAHAKLQALPNLDRSSKKSYISAPSGTPVNAIYPGKIVFAEWLRGLGLLIIIDHGNGYMSLYGNNQKLYKGLGDWVNQGEMIASVGQSGTHAQGGLYFEIRKDGEAIDPTPWFKLA